MQSAVKANEIIRPHIDFKKLYYSYLVIGFITLFLSWAIPVIIYIIFNVRLLTAVTSSLFIVIPFITILIFTALWIPKFHLSLLYLLTESDIIIERGVWWKHKSIVPYNRVTNIEVLQGPLSRLFGLGKVSIQTAGFSAGGSSGSAKVAEAVIVGIKNFEEIKDFVMAKVKRLQPIAIGAEAEATTSDINLQILDELKRIRKNLNKK